MYNQNFSALASSSFQMGVLIISRSKGSGIITYVAALHHRAGSCKECTASSCNLNQQFGGVNSSAQLILIDPMVMMIDHWLVSLSPIIWRLNIEYMMIIIIIFFMKWMRRWQNSKSGQFGSILYASFSTDQLTPSYWTKLDRASIT